MCSEPCKYKLEAEYKICTDCPIYKYVEEKIYQC